MAEPADPWIHHLAHRALQRDSVDLLRVLETARRGDRTRTRSRALARWFGGFGAVVDDLVTLEDRVVFPFLATRVPTYHLHADQIRGDHAQLRRLVRVTGAALDRLVRQGPALDRLPADDPGKGWREAAHAAAELRSLLADHLDLEDQDVLPLFERHVTADEYDVLLRRALVTVPWRRRSFALAWLAQHLDPEELERARTSAGPVARALWGAGRGRYRRLASAALGRP